jgi:hypothetical protein
LEGFRNGQEVNVDGAEGMTGRTVGTKPERQTET